MHPDVCCTFTARKCTLRSCTDECTYMTVYALLKTLPKRQPDALDMFVKFAPVCVRNIASTRQSLSASMDALRAHRGCFTLASHYQFTRALCVWTADLGVIH